MDVSGAGRHGWAPTNSAVCRRRRCVCMCVLAHACARMRAHACASVRIRAHACVRDAFAIYDNNI